MIAKRNIIPIFVPHMGCPNNCVFCDQRRITGSLSAPTAKDVEATITESLRRIPQKTAVQVAFYGGSFTAISKSTQRELLGAAQPFLSRGDISCLRVSTRPDAIDEAVLDMLAEYGVTTIELGCQSMDEDVLIASGRGHTALQIEAAARLIKARGFELILQMMTGLPGDTREKTIETARRLIALSPDGVRIYPSVILENTPMADLWREGKYPEHTVEQAVSWCAEIVPLFEETDITIIRLGLNPTQELSGGAAVAGAYHPALGELVYSRIMLNKAKALFTEKDRGARAVLAVRPSELSKMIGQHRCNVEALVSEFGLAGLEIRATDLTAAGIERLK